MEARLNFADDLAGLLESFLGNGIDLATNLLNFFFGNETRIEEASREEATDGWVRIDFGVEGGLGKVRFVSFVVSVAAIADDIEDDVFMEFLTKFESQLDDGGGSQGIVSVNVKDRQTKSFAGSGTVAGGAGVIGQSGKCDLIIDDDVDGSARAVSFEAGKIDGFSNDTLSDKSTISMDQNGNNFFPFDGVVPKALSGAGFSLYDWVDGLKVTGIGCKGKTDFFSMGGSDLVFVTQVVFHVPVTQNSFRDIVFMEFGEEFTAGFSKSVHENVQAAAVGHADDDLIHAQGGAGFDECIEDGDEGFPAFQGKTLLADIAGVEKALERFSRDNLF